MMENLSFDLSIVIPAFNEERRIGSSLTKIVRFFTQKKVAFEIIVIDDGSSDRTVDVCKEKMSHVANQILVNGKNCGKGYSVRRGVAAARGEIIFFTDADLSTPIEEFDKLMDALEDSCDLAIGSRALSTSDVRVHQNQIREFMGKMFNRLAHIFAFRNIRDSQCGFKAFKKDVAKRLFEKQRVNSFCFDAEILFLAQKMNYRIGEVGVQWSNSPESKVRIVSDSFKMLVDLFQIRWLHWHEK